MVELTTCPSSSTEDTHAERIRPPVAFWVALGIRLSYQCKASVIADEEACSLSTVSVCYDPKLAYRKPHPLSAS